MKLKKVTVSIFLWTSASFLSGQETIELDRPDQTETSSIVPKSFLQIETGYVFEKLNSSENSHQFPTTLMRYGISKKTELRLITEFNFDKIDGFNENKFQPLIVGFKTALTEAKGIIPKISFLGQLELFAENEAGKKKIAPSFKLLFDNELGNGLSLGYNLGMEWDSNFNENYNYTIALGKSIDPKWNIFLESYGFVSPTISADHRLDTGLTYFINNNSAIDISFGKGLSSISPPWFLAFGYSFRVNLKNSNNDLK